jgi:glycyl-tRNA synthetase beta chain
MSEFFLELFSEEIPAGLQQNARNTLFESFQKLFQEKQISFKKGSSFSTPNRLIILFEGLSKEIIQKSEEIKGPNVNAPEKAIEGFLRSNQIDKNDLLKKIVEKGEFYFFKKPSKKINTINLLEEHTPLILDKLQWKKSMRWGEYNLNWARPLKSILAVFDDKNLGFQFHHLKCSNSTFIDKEFEDKKKIFKDFKSYKSFFNQSGIMIDHNLRRKFIVKEFEKLSKKKGFIIESNNKLLNEVTDIVEQPNILVCKFDKKFLNIPKEILIITMQYHQKYFPTFDKKGKITNEFLVVANNKDTEGYIKSGNERVVDARLSDAQFFWEKNKSQNLVILKVLDLTLIKFKE